MSKYYLMTKNKDDVLEVEIDGYWYSPAEDWTMAWDGIVTDIEVVEKGRNEEGKFVGTIRGRMVETEDIDLDSLNPFELYRILYLPSVMMVELYKHGKFIHVVNVKGEGLKPVSFRYSQTKNYDAELEKESLYRVAKNAVKAYELPDRESMLAALIRKFEEKHIYCADSIYVYGNAIFYIGYPTHGRGYCVDYVLSEQDECLSWVLSNVNKLFPDEKRFFVHEIINEMDKHGIATGEDSGDVVEGVSEEERKYLSTLRLPTGDVLVMFKAETFRYDLLENENLNSKVCKNLGKWLFGKGKDNPYGSMMD